MHSWNYNRSLKYEVSINVFKNNIFLILRKIQRVTITKIKWLIMFTEVIAVYSEHHTKHMNTNYTVSVLVEVLTKLVCII
jgi:biotin synthase-related radical SAM superfamily protein